MDIRGARMGKGSKPVRDVPVDGPDVHVEHEDGPSILPPFDFGFGVLIAEFVHELFDAAVLGAGGRIVGVLAVGGTQFEVGCTFSSPCGSVGELVAHGAWAADVSAGRPCVIGYRPRTFQVISAMSSR